MATSATLVPAHSIFKILKLFASILTHFLIYFALCFHHFPLLKLPMKNILIMFFSYICFSFFYCSAWGEGLFLAIQTAIIGVLVLHYNDRVRAAASFLALYATMMFTLTSGLTSVEVLWSMQVLNVPIVVVGKVGNKKR